ncbi:MAG: hypothetical protein WC123_07340 [Bacilli bacterium]
MSIDVSYYSFKEEKADEKWANFDNLFDEAIKRDKRIQELEQEDQKYEYTEEELYTPSLEKQRVEKDRQREAIAKEIRKLEKENKIWMLILIYFHKKEKIEELYELINLDLSWGGKSACFSSSLYPVIYFELTLKILFPELIFKNDSLEKEDLLILFKYKDEICKRLESSKKELQEALEFDDDEFEDYLREDWGEMFSMLLSVAEDVAINNAEYLQNVNSEFISGKDTEKILIERANAHCRHINEIISKKRN